ncbi:MAG: SGNH/GDSL hydrolase family protein [Chitinophagaceae bacterium]|nr:MAG: SGNH/GDSL hydrolase family protein [Chitinophagaceae bacterium]
MINTGDDKPPYSYLALGDSYTIGESVPAAENYPNRSVSLLKEQGVDIVAPKIIAQTGWTTTDLQDAINSEKTAKKYDFVTLLIGVNNQYRNMETAVFVADFENLLRQALRFAGNNTRRVVVFSIPDWSVTPYAKNYLPDKFGRDAAAVSKQIDEYNAACKLISGKYKVEFVDITPGTREAATTTDLLAGDGLHPSGKEYAKWAEKLSSIMKNQLK